MKVEERFDFIGFMYGIACVSLVRSHTILNVCVRVGFFEKGQYWYLSLRPLGIV